jgi:hypothetical protein
MVGSTLIRVIFTCVMLLVLTVHLLFPQIRIDTLALTFLFFSFIPWIFPFFRSVELPGGVRIELRELKEIQKQMAEIGLLKKRKKGRKKYSFESISAQDPSLALIGLRIELERILRSIAQANGLKERKKNIQKLTLSLSRADAITTEEQLVIHDLLSLLDPVARGAFVDVQVFQWAMTTGVAILESLETKVEQRSL